MEILNDKVSKEENQTETSKQKLTFFSARDTPELTLDDFMPDLVMSESTQEGSLLCVESGFYTGATTTVLINRPGFSLVYAWFKSGQTLPVHSHDADCLYYVVAGEAILGNRTLRAGDGFFVPANTFYSYTAGPEGIEIIEFRQANKTNMVYRDSKPEYWIKLAEKIDAKQSVWKTEAPPHRVSTGQG
ncbi:hypothetical protein [Neobacillus sp. FSL H8-0543]|uniref:cupin domain-containing protein n=1 Tax=Neobacillus sp. FSL H8-0543 TaxID=2954672 RepID=UPI0031596ECF